MSAAVFVPASAIKNQEVDYVEEMFSALAVPLTVGALEIPPPPVGCFALLELIDSDFYRRGALAGYEETGRALAIFVHRREAAAWVRDWIMDRPEPLEQASRRCLIAAGEELAVRLAEVVKFLLDAPFTGFAMLPGQSRTATPFIFDGVALGNLALLGGHYAATPPEKTLWETPLTLLGHLAAANAKAQGTQGVGRPKDPDDIRRQLKLARERAERGEPQPWEKQE